MHHWQSSCVLIKEASRESIVGKGSTAATSHDTHGSVHEVCSWVTCQSILCHTHMLLASCCGLLSFCLLTLPQPSHVLGVDWLPICRLIGTWQEQLAGTPVNCYYFY